MLNQSNSSVERLWTVRDLATYLNTTSAAIYPLVKRNGLPHIKLGRSLRFEPTVIREWVERHSRNNGPPPAIAEGR